MLLACERGSLYPRQHTSLAPPTGSCHYFSGSEQADEASGQIQLHVVLDKIIVFWCLARMKYEDVEENRNKTYGFKESCKSKKGP